ncbi:MAG: outer membrane lipoprotein carrier protein LolA [Phycisphaeraceae bacterium]|nr:outer membrane lipoprotein carrier protein LolA [Phycisphaeraceae bacterium]
MLIGAVGPVCRFAIAAACAMASWWGRPLDSFCQPAASQSASSSDGSRFVERLEAVDAAMSTVQDLRADFEQRRHSPLLKKPLVSQGVVRAKGELVRWDTASPRKSSLLVSSESIQMYYPDDGLLEIYPVGEGFRDLAGGPLPRLAVLRERFEIEPLEPRIMGEDGDGKSLALRLTPRSEALRRHVSFVRVLIDESAPAAKRVVMTDPEGEETEIVFSHVRLNTGMKPDDLELKVPQTTRVSRPMGDVRGVHRSEAGAGNGPERTP